MNKHEEFEEGLKRVKKEREIQEQMRRLVHEGLSNGAQRDPETGEYYPFFVSQVFAVVEVLREAGYRKADEVRKETAREILEYLRAVQEKDELKNCDLDWIAMQYGVEVNE